MLAVQQVHNAEGIKLGDALLQVKQDVSGKFWPPPSSRLAPIVCSPPGL
jgi:hypothetical protein